jgi:hypothetical protein
MVECVFCVDFGSAYTKVALRPAVRECGDLIKCGDLQGELWVPTVVAVDWSRGRSDPQFEFGYKAAGVKPGPNIRVYDNFKKDLFAPPGAEAPANPPLETLLQSDEFEALAAKYGVQPPEVMGLRQMLAAARAFGVRAKAGPVAEAQKQAEAKALTAHFMRWLRERVLEACAKRPDAPLRYEDIPLRVAVPALGGSDDLAKHPGCVRFREALAGTGWKLDDRLFVSEPEANAVGVLTGAANELNAKRKIHFREMFGKGPLITVLADPEHHRAYRAMVVDVGAFTTDFAALMLDTDGKTVEVSDGVPFKTKRQSIAYGVTNLDAAVRAGLPEDKQKAIDALARKDFATFQENVYTEGKGYRLGPGRVLGGDADRPAVDAALADFTKRLTAETIAFCQSLGAVPGLMVQELIITGGGSNIPAVRDALLKAAAALPGNAVVKTHAPGIKKAFVGTPVDDLKDKFSRGASALGGASIYFEPGCY